MSEGNTGGKKESKTAQITMLVSDFASKLDELGVSYETNMKRENGIFRANLKIDAYVEDNIGVKINSLIADGMKRLAELGVEYKASMEKQSNKLNAYLEAVVDQRDTDRPPQPQAPDPSDYYDYYDD